MSPMSHARTVWLSRHILPHEASLRAWLRRRRHLPVDIDDLVQESFAVLSALESVEHIHNPRAYLFQTANSLVLRELRRARVVSILVVDDLDALGATADEPSPERQVSDRQELFQLSEALSALPKQCGQAFRLRKIADLSQREIAQRMGLSESTVEKHIAKAILLLMDHFTRDGIAASGASKRWVNGTSEKNAKARVQQ
jgi:RNA polymerase sigma factor (sigma-70 family)